MVALVRTTEEGDRVVCHLPKPPVKKQAENRSAKPAAKQASKPERPTPVQPSPVLDTEALIADITARVLSDVYANLDAMISRILKEAIDAAIPKIVAAVSAHRWAAARTDASISPAAAAVSAGHHETPNGSSPTIDLQ